MSNRKEKGLTPVLGAGTPPATPFRPMRRAKQALSEDEIREVLRSARRGVLSVKGDNGWPYGVYVNPFYDEESGKLYFHGGKIGHKIDALCRDPRACFTVIDEGAHDASRPPAWKSSSARTFSTTPRSSATAQSPTRSSPSTATSHRPPSAWTEHRQINRH